MKKLISLVCLMSFLSVNFCAAIEDYDEDDVKQPVKEAKVEKIVKKDPGLIKLPNKKAINKESFNKKMAKDDREYRKKIKALSSNIEFTYDDNGEILKVEEFNTDENASNEEKEYRQTRDSWLEGYYMFYKVSDRIIRANNLDTQNWRFEIVNDSDTINAYANAANHVVLYSAIVDSFYNNEDALAFLIGHEMSHHALNHGQKTVKIVDDINEIQKTYAMGADAAIGIVVLAPYLIPRERYLYRQLRKQETEADTEALTLMARAGYNVDYANDVIETLTRLGEGRKRYTDTHPRHKDRLKNINTQIAVLDVNALRIEGEKNLYEKPVMTLKRSSDKKTIVLVPENGRGSILYRKATPAQKEIYKAYSAYLNDDMTKAENLFEKAYKMNKKDFVPCLYLSYINEYNYKKNHNEESLKKAKKWANRAYKKNNTEKNTIKQKMDVKALK